VGGGGGGQANQARGRRGTTASVDPAVVRSLPLSMPHLDGSSPRPGRPPREEWTRATPLPSLPALLVVLAVRSGGGIARRRKRGGGSAMDVIALGARGGGGWYYLPPFQKAKIHDSTI
jgi:hypothetical protein